MRSLIAIDVVLVLTLLGLTAVPACAGSMESGKGMTMEKGDAMSKGDSMAESKKGMMKGVSNATMEKGDPGEKRIGKLAGSDSHHAVGTVVIITEQNGFPVLQLRDITVDKVPDGRVYLARNGDYRNGVELGKLTQFSGTVTFTIPAEIKSEDYDSVVIWCQKFNVEIGRGFFEKTRM